MAKKPSEGAGYEKLGEHDPMDHCHDYVDGDSDDYGKQDSDDDYTEQK